MHLALMHFSPFLEGRRAHSIGQLFNRLPHQPPRGYHIQPCSGPAIARATPQPGCGRSGSSMACQGPQAIHCSFCKTDALLVCYGGHREGHALSKQRLMHRLSRILPKRPARTPDQVPLYQECLHILESPTELIKVMKYLDDFHQNHEFIRGCKNVCTFN